jgi:membrane protease YdiL (CAAX protease family)
MKAIIAYTGIAYGLSIALSLFVGLTGGHDSQILGLGYLSMFLPTIAVSLVYLAWKEPPLLSRDHFPLRYLTLALFLMPCVLHMAMLPTMVFIKGRLPWQDWLKPQLDGLYHTPPSRGWGNLTMHALLGRIIFNALIGLAVVSFMAFFEEIGWRAWLLPRLKDRLGARLAVVVVAIIWALWHVPFELSGILHIDGVSPIRLALAVPPGTFAAGLILGWLWLRTENVWLVAIAHGGLNNWGQYAFKYMKESGTPAADIAVLGTGYLALLLVGFFLLWRDGALGPSSLAGHSVTRMEA